MPKVKRPGVVGRYVEFPDELDKRFRAFCESRGETFIANIVMAMERHLAYPPEKPALPSLPGGTAPEQPKRGRRAGKGKAK